MLKLNNRGWGLQVMMLFIIILMIALVIVYVIVQRNFPDLVSSNYQKMENEIIISLKKYYKDYNLELTNQEDKIVSVKTLKNLNLLNNFNKCSGYGLIKNEKRDIKYYAFIRCGNEYTTDGYINYLDEI